MAPKLPPMGMAGMAGLTGLPSSGGAPMAAPRPGPSTPIGPMNADDRDVMLDANSPEIIGIPGRGGAVRKVTQPKPATAGDSVFAPFGRDAQGNPITTPPPGWKYFNWNGMPVAPAPTTGGWSEADRAQSVFGPEAQAPDFADTGGEGADMYEMGLIPQDQIFLPVGAKLTVPLSEKPKTKGKVGKVTQRRSGDRIAK